MDEAGYVCALVVLLAVVLTSAVSASPLKPATLDNALQNAHDRSTFVLVDAYTTWCGPCKKFQRDLESLPELQAAFDPIVFLSVDIEDSLNADFVAAHPTASVPQFILLDPEGVEHGRIVGYTKVERFLQELEQLLANPIPIAEQLAGAEADGSWHGPIRLAEYHSRRGDLEKAAPHYVEALHRDAPSAHRLDLLWCYLVGMREGWATVSDAVALAEEAAVNPVEEERFWNRLYNLMKQVAERAKDDSLRHPYLERAYQEAEEAGMLEKIPPLRFDYAHYALKDHERAAQARRDMLKIAPTPFQANLYAWYCFEHRVCLDDAEAVAREYMDREGRAQSIAMLTDTLAELVHLRGETKEAMRLIEQCIELDPTNEYYRNQNTRFQEMLDDGVTREGTETP